jgi:MFS family permease
VSDDVRARILSFSFLPVVLGFAVGPAIGSVLTQHSIFAIFPAASVITLLGLGMLLVSYRQPAPSSTAVAKRAESVAG